MPELRSGARQTRQKPKKDNDQQAENLILPATNRPGRRGRGRGTRAAKGTSATPARQRVGGRGRGVSVIDLDPEQPGEALPGAQELRGNREVEGIGGKDLVMDGGSAGKIVGAEDEGTAAPVPERVCTSYNLFL